MPQNPNLMPGLMPCDYCQGARVLNVGTQQQPVLYDLSSIYYYAGSGDKITVVYAQ